MEADIVDFVLDYIVGGHVCVYLVCAHALFYLRVLSLSVGEAVTCFVAENVDAAVVVEKVVGIVVVGAVEVNIVVVGPRTVVLVVRLHSPYLPPPHAVLTCCALTYSCH